MLFFGYSGCCMCSGLLCSWCVSVVCVLCCLKLSLRWLCYDLVMVGWDSEVCELGVDIGGEWEMRKWV